MEKVTEKLRMVRITCYYERKWTALICVRYPYMQCQKFYSPWFSDKIMILLLAIFRLSLTPYIKLHLYDFYISHGLHFPLITEKSVAACGWSHQRYTLHCHKVTIISVYFVKCLLCGTGLFQHPVQSLRYHISSTHIVFQRWNIHIYRSCSFGIHIVQRTLKISICRLCYEYQLKWSVLLIVWQGNTRGWIINRKP